MAKRSSFVTRYGITIIELTIVMLILGILAAVVTPAYSAAINRYRIDLAAHRVAADLQYAKTEAQRVGQPRTVRFDVDSNSYALESVSDIKISANDYLLNIADEPYQTTLVSALFNGSNEVEFDIYGRPSSSGEVILQLGTLQKIVNLSADGVTSIP